MVLTSKNSDISQRKTTLPLISILICRWCTKMKATLSFHDIDRQNEDPLPIFFFFWGGGGGGGGYPSLFSCKSFFFQTRPHSIHYCDCNCNW